MVDEHPFAKYVRILARGRSFIRDFDAEEAESSFDMVMRREVLPEQLGAYLMLLRLKEESPTEIAGFVRAVRRNLDIPSSRLAVDLDWSSYAGKRRQLPYFILAAMALANSGVRIFMHGVDGHTPGRLYTRTALKAIGVPVTSSLAEAADAIQVSGFAYISLPDISTVLHEIMELKPVLGLRSPIHTIARMINPFEAPALLQGVFHPGYENIHSGAAMLLGQPRCGVFRGEGGEIERRPNKAANLVLVADGAVSEEHWPALLPEPRLARDEEMRVERLIDIWQDEEIDSYADAAITGTIALALRVMGHADDPNGAQVMAREVWEARDRAIVGAAA
jgi:anthranilate phosphoribosyltransferase